MKNIKYYLTLLQVIIIMYDLNAQTFNCGDTLIDIRDGQKYATVLLGSQCWMKKNLNIGTMIPESQDMDNNGIIEKKCYHDSTANCDIYGGYYQYFEAMNYNINVNGICPVGWHIPTIIDFQTLILNLGGDSIAGGELKESGFTHWLSPNTGATNHSGFTALPGGYMSDGASLYKGDYGLFLTNSYTTFFQLEYFDACAKFNPPGYSNLGFSLRCICDSSFFSSVNETEGRQNLNCIFSKPYPNPVTETSTIFISCDSKINFTIEIYNSIGQLIKKEIIYDSEIKIRNTEFPTGLFIYRILSNSGQMSVGEFEIN